LNILYTIFIFPIWQIIEFIWVIVFRLFNHNPSLSILGVSFAVSVLTLPFYFMAEKHQQIERNIQKKLKPKSDTIKSVFFGDERFMQLSVYYRQNGYHPVFALRSIFPLLIQIPFFIAAWHFLFNLEAIKGVTFGPINDISRPDSLLNLGAFSVNLLPILMTLINCASSYIYSKDFPFKDKFQIYGIALIFLVLLYNSPSALVLYWTGNNLFSLIKNCIQKTKHPLKITLSIVSLVCITLIIFILLKSRVLTFRRLSMAVILGFVSILSLMPVIFTEKTKKLFASNENIKYENKLSVFLLSQIVLFLIVGFFIPSSLIASSVFDFSFIDAYKTPFPFILIASLQALGFFLGLPLCIYFFSSVRLKSILDKISVILCGAAILNVICFPAKYGALSILFAFSGNVVHNSFSIFLNLFVFITFSLVVFFIYNRFPKLILSFLIISVFSVFLAGTINSVNIFKEFKNTDLQFITDKNTKDSIYKISKTGQNVVIIVLDKAVNQFVPFIFEEKPELRGSFDGFTWYSNSISYGGNTIFGIPGIYGGYDYTPLEIQKRGDIPLAQKHNEALLLLPLVFNENNFEAIITDPPYANYKDYPDLSIFSDYPQIIADNVIGKYTANWLDMNQDIDLLNISGIIKNNLIRFSYLRFSPLIFRKFIYDKGNWLTSKPDQFDSLPKPILNNYAALDILPDITYITDTGNNLNIIYNALPHDSFFFQAPEYVLTNTVTNTGSGKFSNDSHYHVNIASFLLISKWLDFLKENDVYDNTRIIIVSDHGSTEFKVNEYIVNISLPNKNRLIRYEALLMVKDFFSYGALAADNSLMTTADAPFFAFEGIIENPDNPWTGNKLVNLKLKDNNVTITTSNLFNINQHPKNTFRIKDDDWLTVHTDIYDVNNWSLARR
jgi:YidC/Oxa1 family membrane protein insertase